VYPAHPAKNPVKIRNSSLPIKPPVTEKEA
jgi:hypothetical protein